MWTQEEVLFRQGSFTQQINSQGICWGICRQVAQQYFENIKSLPTEESSFRCAVEKLVKTENPIGGGRGVSYEDDISSVLHNSDKRVLHTKRLRK